MRPRQMRTQCVRIWKQVVEPLHLLKVAHAIALSKLSGKPFRHALQHSLPVSAALLPLLLILDNRTPDLPVGKHHGGVDGRMGTGARIQENRPNRVVEIAARSKRAQLFFFAHRILPPRYK